MKKQMQENPGLHPSGVWYNRPAKGRCQPGRGEPGADGVLSNGRVVEVQTG
jgi:hypothetical protein